MKKDDFELQWQKRLEENRRLTDRPFLPGAVFPVASLVAANLFYVLLTVSFLVSVIMFGFKSRELMSLSRVILLLEL